MIYKRQYYYHNNSNKKASSAYKIFGIHFRLLKYSMVKLPRWLYLLRGAIKGSITTDEGYKRALKGLDTHHRNAKVCIYADNEPGLIAKGILEQSMEMQFQVF